MNHIFKIHRVSFRFRVTNGPPKKKNNKGRGTGRKKGGEEMKARREAGTTREASVSGIRGDILMNLFLKETFEA